MTTSYRARRIALDGDSSFRLRGRVVMNKLRENVLFGLMAGLLASGSIACQEPEPMPLEPGEEEPVEGTGVDS